LNAPDHHGKFKLFMPSLSEEGEPVREHV